MKKMIAFLEKGEDLLDIGILNEAESLFKGELLVQKQKADLYYYIARAQLGKANYYLKLNDLEKMADALENAMHNCQRSIAIEDLFSDTHRILGVSYGRLVDLKRLSPILYGSKARQELEMALAIDPENIGALVGLSVWYIKASPMFGGDLRKAEEHLRHVLNRNSRIPEAYVWLGIIAVRKGKPQEAEELFGKAYAIKPVQAWVQRELRKE